MIYDQLFIYINTFICLKISNTLFTYDVFKITNNTEYYGKILMLQSVAINDEKI